MNIHVQNRLQTPSGPNPDRRAPLDQRHGLLSHTGQPELLKSVPMGLLGTVAKAQAPSVTHTRLVRRKGGSMEGCTSQRNLPPAKDIPVISRPLFAPHYMTVHKSHPKHKTHSALRCKTDTAGVRPEYQERSQKRTNLRQSPQPTSRSHQNSPSFFSNTKILDISFSSTHYLCRSVFPVQQYVTYST